ncbi:MAG: hypothetical protein WD873_04700 [Candidatus Hydrogenedentales bacterium]
MTYKDLLTTMQAAAEQNDTHLLKQLRQRLDEEGERIILEIDGQPFAALVSLDDLEFFEELEDAADVRAMEEAWAEGGELLSHEEVKRDLERRELPD